MYGSVLTGDYIMACLRSNVNSDQWNGRDRPSARARHRRFPLRATYIPNGRESLALAVAKSSPEPRSMENASRGSRLMALLIIYVDRPLLRANRHLNAARDCPLARLRSFSVFFFFLFLSRETSLSFPVIKR